MEERCLVMDLQFSSMLNPTETYLSREFQDKPKTAKSKAKKLLDIPKSVGKKMNLFRKQIKKDTSLDTEIETAIEHTRHEYGSRIDINKLLLEEEFKKSSQKLFEYETLEQDAPAEKSLFKNLYTTFVSYAKGSYTKASSTTKKMVEGPVKITMLKLIRVFEYVMTALAPQWNRVPGSPEDLDTLAPPITNHISLSGDDLKYDLAYSTLKYRS